MPSVSPKTVAIGGRLSTTSTWGLGLLVAGAAAIRFAGLGTQSFWYDEAITSNIVHFGWTHGLLAQIANGESTPPLYYVLLKGCAQLFGDTEVGPHSSPSTVRKTFSRWLDIRPTRMVQSPQAQQATYPRPIQNFAGAGRKTDR